MSETRFTPGPWRAEPWRPTGIEDGSKVVRNSDGDGIVYFGKWAANNADLIAAAPDLYEAVELLLATPEIADADPRDKDEETQIAERKARAALRKARGE